MSFPRKDNPYDQPKKYWSLSEAKVRIAAYCAYQERCQLEVRNKLHERGIYGDNAEDLIAEMISEGFLNEERFAQAFVRGKFKLKKWGKNKIHQALKMKQVSPYCIKSGMKEIEPEEYWEILKNQAEKKLQNTKEQDDYKRRYKVTQFLMAKGFEHDLVQSVLDELI
ncbi:Regulatory protein RecX [Indibacter alkaliphilus LW1]|jgi:regulatory protein|uniref:Regulatory protein RecX n=1 Tax=Indibacter alkaliphilus (strain CCUG 57479 / KCTC 22604 / LW1) TaxID=1189612 RepID=S2DJI7_INDAL|nr:regulatory protein RecX [Indibacter alkaliphilus]EOZ92136.1 Regulatory protein RecX [Indibacter alkaliphilus LW1]